MPRKKKNPNPLPDEDESNYLGEVEENDPIDVKVDDQAGSDNLIASAEKLLGGVKSTDTERAEKLRGYREKYKAKKKGSTNEDFSTIVVTLLTLALSAWNVPADLKPNGDEVNALSVPATRMLLRHVPITAKLSADALDVIGMIGAMSAYYARTNPAWRKYNEERRVKAEAELQEQNSGIDSAGFPVYRPEVQEGNDGYTIFQPSGGVA